MNRRVALTILPATGVAALAVAPAAGAATREFWVAAAPVTWNMIPNQFDNITGPRFDPAQTVMGTVVYRGGSRGGGGAPCRTRRRAATRT